ncbi:hypothetical protein EO087_10065 [Dyella sp. M7H15-1]|uniref:flagellar basal body-associated FliL family protein n=1 Tax=Dyella sp. M7H15-1 TaxID=2501295 RepID=UPI00100506E2|nr:flagellar basal body-associated FliL family protein [Dyella sp. M7H15-1]QAU24293.1 hypothetical protein EO087_10065 [Dyella sp. M7H15-1]
MKTKLAILGAIAFAVVAGGGVTAWLSGVGPFAKHHAAATTPAKQIEGQAQAATPDSRFVTLDKLIVMLNAPDAARSRYLALDLIFQTDGKREKQVKDQLPLLRSTAYRALSDYSMDDMRGMDVDQLTSVLQEAYVNAYGEVGKVPFSSVQIGRQMLE